MIDSPDPLHWKQTCWRCNSRRLIFGPICDCGSQCGHRIGMICGNCSSHQQPKLGHAWCPNILEIKRLMKDGCVRLGCKREKIQGSDYCGRFHAREDHNQTLL